MVTVPPQLSPVEVALPVLFGSVESPQAGILAVRQFMFVAVRSAKLMCCTQLLVLWQASDAYQVRSTPALPVQLRSEERRVGEVGSVRPPSSPVEVALPVLLGSVESPQASTLWGGQLMFGAGVSAKLMCCTQLLVLWQASDAYQVRSMPSVRKSVV